MACCVVCRRDEALAAIQAAIREQQQQELAVQAEIAGYKRDILRQQVENEQMMATLRKVEGEAGHVAKNIESEWLGFFCYRVCPQPVKCVICSKLAYFRYPDT